MTKLNETTVEHLGQATQDDLDQFKAWVEELMAEREINNEEAIDLLWGDGDYLANAQRLGLWEGSIYDTESK